MFLLRRSFLDLKVAFKTGLTVYLNTLDKFLYRNLSKTVDDLISATLGTPLKGFLFTGCLLEVLYWLVGLKHQVTVL